MAIFRADGGRYTAPVRTGATRKSPRYTAPAKRPGVTSSASFIKANYPTTPKPAPSTTSAARLRQLQLKESIEAKNNAPRPAAKSSSLLGGATSTSSSGGYGGSGGGGGGGSGGGGSGGGGSGGSSGGGSGGGGKTGTVEDARSKALQDALKAIEAQFGAEEAQLLADLAGVGNEWSMRTKLLAKQEAESRRAALEESVRRGIATSSLAAKDQQTIIQEAADERANLTAELGTLSNAGTKGRRAQSIESALKLLAQQMASAKTGATAQSQAGALDLESLLALIGTGISGTALGQ